MKENDVHKFFWWNLSVEERGRGNRDCLDKRHRATNTFLESKESSSPPKCGCTPVPSRRPAPVCMQYPRMTFCGHCLSLPFFFYLYVPFIIIIIIIFMFIFIFNSKHMISWHMQITQGDETLHNKKGSRSVRELWLCGHCREVQVLWHKAL